MPTTKRNGGNQRPFEFKSYSNGPGAYGVRISKPGAPKKVRKGDYWVVYDEDGVKAFPYDPDKHGCEESSKA